jgi:hypothetical protein
MGVSGAGGFAGDGSGMNGSAGTGAPVPSGPAHVQFVLKEVH